MTTALDLFRSANVLIQQHGPEDALRFAAKRADALLELGDVDGQRVWKRVLRAIEELARTTTKDGDHLN